ncbi:MAG: response regulator, partial [Pseudomonadota bacterium]
MRLLVIEDDKDVSSYIAKGMSEAGHTVDNADNGKDGLFLATTEEYDVLIVDRMIPDPDGLTIIKTIRGAGNHTPVL